MSLRGVLAALALLCAFAGSAKAQITCIETYLEGGHPAGLSFTPNDIDDIVAAIGRTIGLDAKGITSVPCNDIDRVKAYYFTDKVRPGEYILYNTQWLREVVGVVLHGNADSASRAEAIVLFGHELGHFLGRHFTTNKEVAALEKETAADRFAGCASAGMGVEWAQVEAFLSRLRGDIDTTHPSREHSIAAASTGYKDCSRRPTAVRPPDPQKVAIETFLGEYFELGSTKRDAIAQVTERNANWETINYYFPPLTTYKFERQTTEIIFNDRTILRILLFDQNELVGVQYFERVSKYYHDDGSYICIWDRGQLMSYHRAVIPDSDELRNESNTHYFLKKIGNVVYAQFLVDEGGRDACSMSVFYMRDGYR